MIVAFWVVEFFRFRGWRQSWYVAPPTPPSSSFPHDVMFQIFLHLRYCHLGLFPSPSTKKIIFVEFSTKFHKQISANSNRPGKPKNLVLSFNEIRFFFLKENIKVYLRSTPARPVGYWKKSFRFVQKVLFWISLFWSSWRAKKHLGTSAQKMSLLCKFLCTILSELFGSCVSIVYIS